MMKKMRRTDRQKKEANSEVDKLTAISEHEFTIDLNLRLFAGYQRSTRENHCFVWNDVGKQC